MKKITHLFIGACALTSISNVFGMENSSDQKITQKNEKKAKDQQPQDITKLLKRNNELLLASIRQNHLIYQADGNRMEYYCSSQQHQQYNTGPMKRAHVIECKLENLYKKYHIMIENSFSSSSSED